MASGSVAKSTFLLENAVTDVTEADLLFKHDEASQQAARQQKPWSKDPHFFKKVRISALALLKMAMHARSGGTIEVMGTLMGKVINDTFVVIDCFALPVEGTETRVNAGQDAFEYMVNYTTTIKESGRAENVIGWYHSHPGYGCWLSGIDVSTQMENQKYQDPWLAIVVDPMRTMAAGKVELGAFRTYPEGYKAPDEGPSEYQSVPLNKIEDFGVHAKQYYPLDVSYFKSSLDDHLFDLLWNKYWISTLSSSPMLSNRDFTAGQLADLAEKIEQTASQMGSGSRGGGLFDKRGKDGEGALQRLARDAQKVAAEHLKGLSSQVVKGLIFNRHMGCGCGPGSVGARQAQGAQGAQMES